jgi:hypothetical protein
MVLAPRLGKFDRPWQAGVRRCMGHEVVSPVRSMGLMRFDFRTAITPTQGKSWCGPIDVELIEINLCPRDARWNVLQG